VCVGFFFGCRAVRHGEPRHPGATSIGHVSPTVHGSQRLAACSPKPSLRKRLHQQSAAFSSMDVLLTRRSPSSLLSGATCKSLVARGTARWPRPAETAGSERRGVPPSVRQCLASTPTSPCATAFAGRAEKALRRAPRPRYSYATLLSGESRMGYGMAAGATGSREADVWSSQGTRMGNRADAQFSTSAARPKVFEASP
jgi:hypothetical protein